MKKKKKEKKIKKKHHFKLLIKNPFIKLNKKSFFYILSSTNPINI